jgi:uncharacterized protein YecE (DUF72 family)
MDKIYIGTSGYSYKDWIGSVYPQNTMQNEFLSVYSSMFNFVELNFSYYTQPKKQIIQRMVDNTKEGFLFAIKAHKTLTHEITEKTDSEMDIFMSGIEPLIEGSRLAAVLMQFPYSFHYNDETRMHLDKVCRYFENLPLAVEFRNDEWNKESVLNEFRKRNICIVNVDEPDLPKLPGPDDAVTSELGYIRFHGRNKENWWKGTNTSRYDYLYSEDELESWIPRIKNIVKKVKILIVAFNNHYKGQAVKNAKDLTGLLERK